MPSKPTGLAAHPPHDVIEIGVAELAKQVADLRLDRVVARAEHFAETGTGHPVSGCSEDRCLSLREALPRDDATDDRVQ